ncbi:hypothetical protein EZV62_006563 [Acer yangbiense]|uniref:Pectinesterase n=1 Tax=Acer yangbiense TaxID=1000413 RepID=A0A5C7I896_9ROSI|nr:hypothetical protein EZV62_006563 [Acer yangbiense]
MNIVYEEGIELTSLFIKAGENATDPFLKMNIRTCIEEFDIGSYRVKTYGIPAFEKGDYAEANNEIGFIVGGSSNCNDTGIKLFNKKVETSFNFSRNVLDLLISAQLPNVTVAVDGTGDYRSIVEAVGVIPNNSDTFFYIHIKAGFNYENVHIGPEKRKIVMSGDGIGKTNVVSSLSNSSGFGIGESAALNIKSNYFLAKDMSIINNAGPNAGQAVALSTYGDYIACYRCSIEGYQDTLYTAHGANQFFSYCNIYGTVDFIFGDAAVVIQNSYISVRLPSGGQTVVTADGRIDAKLNTAIVIHNCSISPTPELQRNPNVKTYLGRPRKKFSLMVVMQSYLDAFIDPQGWLKFDSSSDLASLYYAEYGNSGNGSFTSGRVNRPGYHILNNPDDVQSFTVEKFINGSEWLPILGVPFIPDLIR